MVVPDNLSKAIEIVQQAIEYDEAQKYVDACQEYLNALEYFMLALKYERNDQFRILIRTKINEYLGRAETLRRHLKTAGHKGAVNTGDESTSGDVDQDSETTKLRAGLLDAILTEAPNVKWDDIAGLEGAKASLKEAVILPLKFPGLFTGMRKPWKGILLYGPPGTGKSYLAKAVATEAQSTFFSMSSSDLVSKWQGDSEKLIKHLFQLAREKKPSIIFIDEVDSLTGSRGEGESEAARRIKTEFLVQMDGVGRDDTGVLVIGATNIPWHIDPSIRRRFEKRIHIPLPGPAARRRMFQLHVGSTPNELVPGDHKVLSEKTNGYSGADISVVVRDALMQPIRKFISATHFRPIQEPDSDTGLKWTPCSPGHPEAVEKSWTELTADEIREPSLVFSDFLKSLESVRPTVAEADIQQHEAWTAEFGNDGA
ncbi:AAA-domain-containing protein [Collybia nuda]|uniref:vesicle-fusing ATPase n=1 Tax=Collybia nuda TaxID=64659 RepID=A0A9P6CM44_9AGAR|nr:AAA-domain-containing protein [Collybia nuda]